MILAAARPRPAADPVDTAIHDALVRARVSGHLRALAVVPTIAALAEHGVLRSIRYATEVSAESLAQETQADDGYLRVALRLLASCGWLDEQCAPGGACCYRLTPEGQVAFDAAPAVFRQAAAALAAIADLPQTFSGDADAAMMATLLELRGLRIAAAEPGPHADPGVAGLLEQQLDGLAVSAAMVALAHAGILDLLTEGPLRLLAIDDLLQAVVDVLAGEGWVTRTGGDLHLTPAGERAALLAPLCAEVWSYVPTFIAVPSRFFDGPDDTAVMSPGEEAINVWGRGSAFRPWSPALDEIILELFNRPIGEQPRGLCDAACGSGALLAYVYSVVRDRTARGRVLKEHPLSVIGMDGSRLARETAARTLRAANVVRFHVGAADANHPQAIADDAGRQQMAVRDLLHLRAFAPSPLTRDTAADPVAVWSHVFEQWVPHASRFGLVVLERHPAATSAGALGADMSAASAYEAALGYAGRTLTGLDTLVDAARRAGLDRHPRLRAQFPQPDSAAVSVSYFTVARAHP